VLHKMTEMPDHGHELLSEVLEQHLRHEKNHPDYLRTNPKISDTVKPETLDKAVDHALNNTNKSSYDIGYFLLNLNKDKYNGEILNKMKPETVHKILDKVKEDTNAPDGVRLGHETALNEISQFSNNPDILNRI